MDDIDSVINDSTDSDSKISTDEIKKSKKSSDSTSKKSTSGNTKSTSSQLKPAKITHIYKNDKSLKNIPIIKETKDVLVIFLQNNSITKIENLENFLNLTHLYLQWNNIKTIEGLNNLKNLQKLYLGHNEINVIENLEELPKLTELHIGKQNIQRGDVIVFDPKCMEAIRPTLTLLNISGNRMTNLDPIIRLHNLSVLVAKDNNLNDLNNVVYNLSNLGNLKELHLKGNPICKLPHYKESIIAKCKSLEIIDGHAISEQTKDFVNRLENRRTSLMSLREEKEKSVTSNKLNVSKNGHRRTESPNAHLIQLEAKRLAAARNRELRLKQLDCSKGKIPRCFWRNVASERVKEYVNYNPDQHGDTSALVFGDTNHLVWP